MTTGKLAAWGPDFARFRELGRIVPSNVKEQLPVGQLPVSRGATARRRAAVHSGWRLAAGNRRLPTEYPANGSLFVPRIHRPRRDGGRTRRVRKKINGQASRLISTG